MCVGRVEDRYDFNMDVCSGFEWGSIEEATTNAGHGEVMVDNIASEPES